MPTPIIYNVSDLFDDDTQIADNLFVDNKIDDSQVLSQPIPQSTNTQQFQQIDLPPGILADITGDYRDYQPAPPKPEKTWGEKYLDFMDNTLGVASPYATQFISGATLGYLPAQPLPEDANTIEKIGSAAANLGGMGLNMAVLPYGKVAGWMGKLIEGSKWYPKVISQLIGKSEAISQGIKAGGEGLLYGAAEHKKDPEESRIKNAMTTGATFALFGLGGGTMKDIGKKISPTIKRVLTKVKDAEPLTKSEAKILKAFQAGEAVTLGAGAGATQPAKNLDEFAQNVIVGAGSFGAVHGVTGALSRTKNKGGLTEVNAEPADDLTDLGSSADWKADKPEDGLTPIDNAHSAEQALKEFERINTNTLDSLKDIRGKTEQNLDKLYNEATTGLGQDQNYDFQDVPFDVRASRLLNQIDNATNNMLQQVQGAKKDLSKKIPSTQERNQELINQLNAFDARNEQNANEIPKEALPQQKPLTLQELRQQEINQQFPETPEDQLKRESNQRTINQFSEWENRKVDVPDFTETPAEKFLTSKQRAQLFKERQQGQQRARREQGLLNIKQYEISKNDPEKAKKEKFFHDWAVKLGDEEIKKAQKNKIYPGDVKLGQKIVPFKKPGLL
ncbi:MAG: hypothetical protein J7L71_02280, partial [Spirochaetaceae bacterium]|nr:hypothetical protein [Spirochaetaceae bacterium]